MDIYSLAHVLGKPKVTKMLIESGANVNIVGERGRYPLEAAVVNIVHDNASSL